MNVKMKNTTRFRTRNFGEQTLFHALRYGSSLAKTFDNHYIYIMNWFLRMYCVNFIDGG